MTPLTVACVWVRGPVSYTVDYVVRLERMARRYLSRPFRFVCLTDRPDELPPTVEPIAIKWPPFEHVPGNGVGYWAKVHLFNPAMGFAGRVLYLDLDSLIVNDLDPIVDAPAALALTADALVNERAHLDRDKHGRQILRQFNSSVMSFDGGTAPDLFTLWDPGVTFRLSTDQDWIAERHPEAMGLPYEWFPRISRMQPPWPDEAKVVLVKKPKPHVAVHHWPWFEEAWGGWAA